MGQPRSSTASLLFGREGLVPPDAGQPDAGLSHRRWPRSSMQASRTSTAGGAWRCRCGHRAGRKMPTVARSRSIWAGVSRIGMVERVAGRDGRCRRRRRVTRRRRLLGGVPIASSACAGTWVRRSRCRGWPTAEVKMMERPRAGDDVLRQVAAVHLRATCAGEQLRVRRRAGATPRLQHASCCHLCRCPTPFDHAENGHVSPPRARGRLRSPTRQRRRRCPGRTRSTSSIQSGVMTVTANQENAGYCQSGRLPRTACLDSSWCLSSYSSLGRLGGELV